MTITHVTKRDGTIQSFTMDKIVNAVIKAFNETTEGTLDDAKKVAKRVEEKTIMMCKAASNAEPGSRFHGMCKDGHPAVEEIQDIVEEALMELDYFETAKAFILYRQGRKKLRERDIFKRRITLKPYEYPELNAFVDAIRQSYWIHTEFNFTGDINDFKVNAKPHEQNALRNAMLAISQIEVAVKTFWGNIYKRMPKPEIASVGMTFAESEVRHMDAYSHLLDILGLNESFAVLSDVPAIKKRVAYLDKTITMSQSDEDQDFARSVALFALFIENVSLFSQFLIITSFNQHRRMFKGIANAVEATSKEEQIHAMFGTDLINIIQKEHPEWFDDEYKSMMQEFCREAFEAETSIIDWIFEEGELEFLPKKVVLEFIKKRMNDSLKGIGIEPIFDIDEKLIDEVEWFETEMIATKHVDFFYKRSVNYNKRGKSITSDDLF